VLAIARRTRSSALALLIALSASAQTLPEFSGTWRVEESRSISPKAEIRPQRRGFTLVIEQTKDEVRLSFPALPTVVCKLDGSENVYLHDAGAAWTKLRTWARWDGVALTLKSITLNGWWKDSNPASVWTQDTQLEETRVFKLDPATMKLRMDTQGRDEKPFEVKYTDLLSRVF